MAITTVILLMGLTVVNMNDETTFDGMIIDIFDDLYDGFRGLWDTESVTGATDDTAAGSVTLNAVPSVSGVDFQTDAYVSDEALDPVTVWQRLNFTVSTSAGISDILNVTIWIFDDSLHGGDYNSSGTVDGVNNTQFKWNESDDQWTVSDQGTMSQWSVDNTNSNDPGAASSATTYEFSMRFNISMVARAQTTDWNASVHVYDDDVTPEADYSSESTLVTMNDYYAIEYDSATFSWGTVQPSTTNNTISGGLLITVYANNQWEIRINSTDFNKTGESDVDIEANDITIWEDDGAAGGQDNAWIRNTIQTLTDSWDNQAPMNDESGYSRNFYFWFNPGALFVPGEWNCYVRVFVQANV